MARNSSDTWAWHGTVVPSTSSNPTDWEHVRGVAFDGRLRAVISVPRCNIYEQPSFELLAGGEAHEALANEQDEGDVISPGGPRPIRAFIY